MRCRFIIILGHLCWIFGVCFLVISLVLSTKTESRVNSGIIEYHANMPCFWWGGIGVSIDLQSPKNKKMQLCSVKTAGILVIFNI